jgi:hypothetical protein
MKEFLKTNFEVFTQRVESNINIFRVQTYDEEKTVMST